MKNTYSDLVEQTFDWPSQEFMMTEDHSLEWNILDLKPILSNTSRHYGLPIFQFIDENIQRARHMCHVAMAKVYYDAE